jgi:hypothetical protein
MSHFPPKKKNLVIAILICGWLAASGWGMWRLAAYSLASGAQDTPSAQWPAGSATERNSGGFTIVIALHPECPCSEATVEELDRIIAHGAGRLQARLLFVELPGLPPAEESKLWRRADRIAGVRLIKDAGGAEARRFSTRTSGDTRLYGPDGILLFHGGITAARGHVGDNPGQAAITALLKPGARLKTPILTPVFGCALWNDTPNSTP